MVRGACVRKAAGKDENDLEVSQDFTIIKMQKGATRLTGCSFYFCLFLRYRKISVFTNHAVAIAVIPKIAFIDQLYAKVAVFIAFQFFACFDHQR